MLGTSHHEQKSFQSGLISQTERQNKKIFREKYFYDTREFKTEKLQDIDSIKLL